LCAGLGTRLRPLTDETPKPLLWVYDRPQVEHVFAHLVTAGFTSCVINTHHLAERFSVAWLSRQSLAVEVAHEPELLGTGGALVNAAQALGAGDVLLWNADMLGAPDLAELLAAHRAKAVSATLLTSGRFAAGHGTVGVSADGAVVRLRTYRSAQPELFGTNYVGIAVLSERLRARLVAPGCLVADGLMPALLAGETVQTLLSDAPFIDIGSPQALLEANLGWLERSAAQAAHAGCNVDASARVAEGAQLEATVVAAQAVVGRATLRRCLVLPGARVEDGVELERAIVWSGGVISLG
jgi:mannose-1-phosphate guanylyltransferase